MIREFGILNFALRIGSPSEFQAGVNASALPRCPSPPISAKSKISLLKSKIAFSLIEIIAALALAGVLAALLWPLLGTSLTATVETNSQLAAAHALRSEMETWIHLSRTTYASQFDDLPTLIDGYFQNAANIAVTENQWVALNLSGTTLTETAATPPADHLRVTLRHTTGQQLTFLFTRPLE